MIEESKIPNWDNKVVPIKDVLKYPQCRDSENGAPKNFYVAIFCGSRGTGKSFQLAKMLKTVQDKGTYTPEGVKIDNRIILVSPTAFSPSNNCFKCLDGINWEDDIMEDYDEDAFKAKIQEVKKDQDEAKQYQEYCRCYKVFEKVDDINQMDIKDMMLLYAKDFQHPDDIDKPKYPNGFITTIILDDLLGSKAFKLGRNYLTNCIIRNRHTAGGLNFCIAVQAINSVPKNVRLNSNFISMFKFANKKSVINDIMPNLSAWVSEEELIELYDYATETEPHSSLIADMTRGAPIFKKNFDKLLKLSKKKSLDNIENDKN